MRSNRSRKSAKQVITQYCNELLVRPNDPHREQKLIAIEHIAFKMNWKDLYEHLRFKKNLPIKVEPDEPKEVPERWWDR